VRWALLHSPLTGPSVWTNLALEAGRRGVEATVLAMPDLSSLEPPYYWKLGAALANQIGAPTTLVVHSGAGGLATCVAAASAGRVEQVVFVDAILPHPNRSWFSTANEALGGDLRSRAKGGLLPSWDQWFAAGVLESLVADHGARKRFSRELKPTPIAFMEEAAPGGTLDELAGWSYLRLSKAYESEAREARHLGRPTLRLDLHHLAMMSHPAEVFVAIRNLVRA
jgi:pimeloyl-ACP methyl ester carboxylesterase